MVGRFDVVAYLKLFRFPLVFTAIADSAAGYMIGNPSISQPWVMVLLACASTGLYFFGMALNDIADREKDKKNAPTRVLVSGRLSLKSAKKAAYGALAFSLVAILLVLDVSTIFQRIAAWALVALSIIAYNMFLKIPPTMGLVRAFNLLMGVAAGRLISFDLASQPWHYGILVIPALVYVSALTYVSTLEDAEPSRRKVMVGVILMGVGAVLAILAGPARKILAPAALSSGTAGDPLWAILFAIILIGVLVRRATLVLERKDVTVLVRDGVAGIIFLDATLLASCEDVVSGLLVASLVVPAALSVAVFRRLV